MLGMFKHVLDSCLKPATIWIDNNAFRFHYKATFAVYITASALVTSGQYIGDPIDCIVDGIPSSLMDTYCWIHSTFSIPSRWVGEEGRDVPHPGISPVADLEEGTEVKYHKYYQWVAFVLFLQAGCFYLPAYFWKVAESGKVKLLVQDLQQPMLEPEKRASQIDEIVKYFRLHRGTHALYAFKFFLCELLNLINVIGQIYFTDLFLGYEFSTYGMDVWRYSGLESEDRPDPMKKVFPKVTKCTFHKYGPSGTIEKKDGLCVLPLNIINEKIFLFVWFWLVALAAITVAFLVWRVAVILGTQIRVAVITVKGGKSTKRSDVAAILDTPTLSFAENLGDWFLLYLICKNVNALVVNDLVKELHKAEIGDNFNTETLKLKPENEPLKSAV